MFEDDTCWHMIFEPFEHGNLQDLLDNRFTLIEIEVQCIAKKLIDVLLYLKSKNIVHANLTLKNIKIHETMEIKVSDFS